MGNEPGFTDSCGDKPARTRHQYVYRILEIIGDVDCPDGGCLGLNYLRHMLFNIQEGVPEAKNVKAMIILDETVKFDSCFVENQSNCHLVARISSANFFV